RDVQAPHVDPAAPRPDRARLEDRVAVLAEPRLTRETLAHVLEAHARDYRDAVPLVDAPCGDLVTKRLERCDGELLGLALGLLEGQDVHVRPLEEGHRALGARPDRVDVPRRDSHPFTVPLGSNDAPVVPPRTGPSP